MAGLVDIAKELLVAGIIVAAVSQTSSSFAVTSQGIHFEQLASSFEEASTYMDLGLDSTTSEKQVRQFSVLPKRLSWPPQTCYYGSKLIEALQQVASACQGCLQSALH